MFQRIITITAGLLLIAVAGLMGVATAPSPAKSDDTVQVDTADESPFLDEDELAELNNDGEIGEPLVVENDSDEDMSDWTDPDVPTEEEIANGDVTSEVHEGNWAESGEEPVLEDPGCN